jgi:hypothetical protein
MKRPVVLDIETIPQLASLDVPFDESSVKVPANYKDPIKIAAYIDSARRAWPERLAKDASVDPFLGRVLCTGWGYRPEDIQVDYALTEADEKQILEATWQRLADNDGRVAGWNSRGFDLRFLMIRSMALRVQPTLPPSIMVDWLAKYRSIYHTDAKLLLMDGDAFNARGVDEVAASFHLPGKTEGMSGADVWPAFQRGEHDRIKSYLRDDVRAEMAIIDTIAPWCISPVDGRRHAALMEAYTLDKADFSVLAGALLEETPRVTAAPGAVAPDVVALGTAADVDAAEAPALALGGA